MPNFELQITVNKDRARDFNKDGLNFCFAKSSQSSNSSVVDNYTAVAIANSVETKMDVQWAETYQMCGSTQTFSSGVTISGSTDTLPIDFGQTYTVPVDNVDVTVAADPSAPKKGFEFHTHSPQNFRAVLFQMVNNSLTPVYITPGVAGLPPDSTDKITPVENVIVFFMKDGQQGTMLDVESTDPFQITMNDSVVHADYGADGKWTIVPPSK